MKKLKNWWILTIAGLLLIALGAFALVSPFDAYILLIQYSGVTTALNGVFLLIAAFTNTSSLQEKEWLVTESVLDFVFGVALAFNPFFSLIAFPFLIGSWVMGKGFLKIAASLGLRKILTGWLLVFSVGILSVIFGVLIMYNPLSTAAGVPIFIGIFAVILGAMYVLDSFRFKKTEGATDLLY